MYSIHLMSVDILRHLCPRHLVLNKILLEGEDKYHQTSKIKKHNHMDKHLFMLTSLCYP